VVVRVHSGALVLKPRPLRGAGFGGLKLIGEGDVGERCVDLAQMCQGVGPGAADWSVVAYRLPHVLNGCVPMPGCAAV
jgi:hypothetical protein